MYHGSTVGRPNMSSTDPVGSKLELELLPSSLLPLGVVASSGIGGSPSPKEVSLHFLTNRCEEEAIFSVQGREKEEKEKEKEEEGLGFVYSECDL